MQKYANLVDLVKSFPKSIYLQKSASIQPRTSPSKFEGKFHSLFTSLLNFAAAVHVEVLVQVLFPMDHNVDDLLPKKDLTNI